MKVILFDFVNVLYDPIRKELNEDVLAYVKELKERGIPLFLFTNVTSEKLILYDKKLDFLKYFTKATNGDLYVKPDVRAYECLEAFTGEKFEEMIYIDDSFENVEIGKTLGIKGIQFVDIKSLKRELEKLLI